MFMYDCGINLLNDQTIIMFIRPDKRKSVGFVLDAVFVVVVVCIKTRHVIYWYFLYNKSDLM